MSEEPDMKSYMGQFRYRFKAVHFKTPDSDGAGWCYASDSNRENADVKLEGQRVNAGRFKLILKQITAERWDAEQAMYVAMAADSSE